jgi:hypothetical protein
MALRIVWKLETGWCGSTCATAFLTACGSAAGSVRVRTARVIVGHRYQEVDMYMVGVGSSANPSCRTSPTTPTTVKTCLLTN